MKIGPYEVVSEVGRGGMGVVYKATDLQNNRVVAIKTIRGAGALHSRERMALVREARTTSELRHPNIVEVYDIGQHKGRLFIVMEYLEGHSLDRIVTTRTTMGVPDKLEIILKVCCGLGYAHGRGVIHRDIKPANIFILHNSNVKLLDFGIARLAEATLSARSAFAGTLCYMSPEQLSGDGLDARSDIWAVGVTLYQLLTYRLPFNGTSVSSLLESIRYDSPAPLDSSLMLSAQLNEVLRKALAKNRDARYQTIEDLAKDLRNALPSTAGGPATLDVALEADFDKSREAAPIYAPPDVGFHGRSQSKVEFERRGFNFKSGLRERIKQYLAEADRDKFRTTSLICGVPPLLLATAAIWGGLSQGSMTLDLFGMELLGALVLVPVTVIGTMLFAMRHANVTIARSCRTCTFCRMRRVSRWSRFVTANTEIVMGFNDCVAALREGIFEDAAKLLCVHGSETEAIYTVIRYNLEFWECPKCLDQSALIIIEDRFVQRWQRRNEYFESYKYSERARM